jgi:hypothetical protein
MDGSEAGVVVANMAVMKLGRMERDDVGDAGEQSCIGASKWPSKAADTDSMPGSGSRAVEASDTFGENSNAGRTEDGEDWPVGEEGNVVAAMELRRLDPGWNSGTGSFHGQSQEGAAPRRQGCGRAPGRPQ